jgi:hypothetical protein
MKSLLTFTLAAGVAITTTSIAQAGGVGKVAANAERTAATQTKAPMTTGAMAKLTLDRPALNRELNRLRALLQPIYEDPQGGAVDTSARSMGEGIWTY